MTWYNFTNLTNGNESGFVSWFRWVNTNTNGVYGILTVVGFWIMLFVVFKGTYESAYYSGS